MIITSIPKTKRHSTSNEHSKKTETVHQALQMTCHICANIYDSFDHRPMALCPEEHTYCQKCVSELFSHQNKGTRCPTCRLYIYQSNIRINKSFLRLCELIPAVVTKVSTLEAEKNELESKIQYMLQQFNKKQFEENNLNKQNMNKNGEFKQQFNGFPLIHPNQLINKSKKVNIHSYVARRRRMSSAVQRKSSDIMIDQVGLKKKMI